MMRILAGLCLITSLASAFPHLEIERSPILPSIQATENYINKLERELEDLRWKIQVNEDYQKANDYIRDLAEEGTQKVSSSRYCTIIC